MTTFIETEYASISHQFAQFTVAHVDYIIDFSSDDDVIEGLFPLYKHYLVYKPECYFFIAERPSLGRMYQKMCDNRHPLMIDFEPIGKLGDNADCFIIKTPNYKE